MALPDYLNLIAGTAITWKSSGGDKALTLTSLSNGSGREGDKSGSLIDGTYGLPELLEFRLESSVASAVSSTELELWIGESDNATAGSDNPGGLTGADASLASPDQKKLQLSYVGSLIFSNAIGTSVQKQRFRYAPLCAYVIPLLVNKTGQALGSTAADHKLVMTPYYRRLAD